ncbi:hypothetical protein N7478_010203 [Penicillium angulare]|uniref:uncharacterized protein n=1 Tax=Penicillium angulare TaxID=116970 RepID=UPI002541AF46|nr:uncharacterized protein N7478_010203 [Penicillium angulare]KAJ5267395.1 hypothetical protein N7478_010203 [Penicillium angulare]
MQQRIRGMKQGLAPRSPAAPAANISLAASLLLPQDGETMFQLSERETMIQTPVLDQEGDLTDETASMIGQSTCGWKTVNQVTHT